MCCFCNKHEKYVQFNDPLFKELIIMALVKLSNFPEIHFPYIAVP